MNNLVKRNNDVSYDPFVDFYNMEPFWPGLSRSNNLPSVNISEDDKNYCVDVIAPGFNKEDFNINVDNDMLTISAESKSDWNDENEAKEAKQNDKTQKNKDKTNGHNGHDHERQYSRREYSYSSFTRTFRLPENTNDDNITANYKNGVLKLMIPKSKEEEKATKQISVN